MPQKQSSVPSDPSCANAYRAGRYVWLKPHGAGTLRLVVAARDGLMGLPELRFRILAKVARRVVDDQVLAMVKQFLKSTGDEGVPQGSPLSPMCTNLGCCSKESSWPARTCRAAGNHRCTRGRKGWPDHHLARASPSPAPAPPYRNGGRREPMTLVDARGIGSTTGEGRARDVCRRGVPWKRGASARTPSAKPTNVHASTGGWRKRDRRGSSSRGRRALSCSGAGRWVRNRHR